MPTVNWGNAWATVLTGLIVVFVALIALVIIVYCFGRIMDSLTGKPKKKKAPKAAPEEKPQKAAAPAPSVVEVVSDGLSDEVVAAITAAVSAILAEEGDGKTYVVKSIKRVRKHAPAWRRAGIAEDVRAF